MSKIVKLKQSDIVKIVKNVISENENEFDDFDTKIQPEELPQEPEMTPEDMEDQSNHPISDVLIGKDENDNIIIIDTNTGNIIGKK